MALFNNPWGKGSDEHDKWFKNIWKTDDDKEDRVFANALTQVLVTVRRLETIIRNPNPEGKKSNAQLLAFDWKGTAEKLNNPMNWEMGSGEWNGQGPEPFEKGPSVTSTTTYRTEFVFPTAESINKWNEQLEEVKTTMTDAGGLGVAIATMRIHPWLGVALGYIASKILNKLLIPADVNLNPGDKIVTTTIIETTRSTQRYQNHVQISSSMTSVGTNPKMLNSAFGILDLDPNNLDEDNQLMKSYESDPATITTFTNPDYLIGRPEFRLVRTN